VSAVAGLALGAGLAAAACLLAGLPRRLALRRSIRRTEALAAAIVRGELEHPPAAGERGPLESVDTRLRELADQLRGAGDERRRRELALYSALESSRETLEEKVRERTADLSQAYNELKSLDAMKNSIISSVSHELRTPLSSIRAFSEILLNYADEDPGTRREFLSIVQTECDRLSRLVNDILDLSKLESGKLEMKLRATDFRDVVRHTMEVVQVLAADNGLTLETDIPAGLPPVMADPDRLAQVMNNLLANAVKFTPKGGAVRVSARLAEDAGRAAPPGSVEVRVEDTGPGVPIEHVETVFEKFRQVGDSLTGKPSGTGLGLPICREIVQRLGGRIWVERGRRGGACFVFTLSAASRLEDASAEARPESTATSRRAQPLALDLPAAGAAVWPDPAARASGAIPPTVGVVDDDVALVEVVTESLRVRGFHVVKATDGVQALALAKAHPLDLLILDLQMPRMSGWQVLEAIRSDPVTSSLPVIMLTGWAEEGDRIRALSLGAIEYLQKGQGLSRLCAEIEMATRGLRLKPPAADCAQEPAGA
jgi:signal transduction histidine kinase/ActR/RegA family two-component response regulator